MTQFKRVTVSKKQLEDGYLDAQTLSDMKSLVKKNEQVDLKLAELEALHESLETKLEAKYNQAAQDGFQDGWKTGFDEGKTNATSELLKIQAMINLGFRDLEQSLNSIVTDALRMAFSSLTIEEKIEAAVRAQVNQYRTQMSSQMYVHPTMVPLVEKCLVEMGEGFPALIQVFADETLDVDALEYEYGDKILDLSPVSQLTKAVNQLLAREGHE